jgi:hypothetical protein
VEENMTGDEARTLARRIVDTWPTAAKGYIWQDILTPLDATRAANAYHQLVTEATTRAPSPGQLLAIYHAEEHHPPEHHGPYYDPADGPIMSLEQYLASPNSDPVARRALQRWAQAHKGAL